MKWLYTILFLDFACATYAQQPAILSLKGYGGSGIDQVGTYAIPTTDGGFIIPLHTNSAAATGNLDSFCIASGERIIFIKYNTDASVQEWSRCYTFSGDSNLTYIFPTPDGGNILAGSFTTQGSGIYIAKHDATDNIVWSRSHSRGGNTGSTGNMLPTSDGGYLIASMSLGIDTNILVHYGGWMDADISLFKLDSLGNKMWCKVYGGTGFEYMRQLIEAPRHGWYILGSTSSNDHDCTDNHGMYDVYLARLDSNGDMLWHKDLGGSGDDRAWNAWPNGKGGLIIAANTSSQDGDVHHHIAGNNFWALEVDSSGSIIWDNCFGGGGTEYPSSVCKAADGSIWIAGSSQQAGGQVYAYYGGRDAFIVHADSAGNFLSSKILGSSVLEADIAQMIYPLPGGLVFAAGCYGNNDCSFISLSTGGINAFTTVLAAWTTGVTQVSTVKHKAKIYPNPAKEEININLEDSEKAEIEIVDVAGKKMYKGSIKSQKKISVDGWPKGVYYIKLIEKKGGTEVQKVVVQ